MIKVLCKLGENKKVMQILRDAGWNGSYASFAMQKTRGCLSKEVSLILWEYCQKNGIDVKREDF